MKVSFLTIVLVTMFVQRSAMANDRLDRGPLSNLLKSKGVVECEEAEPNAYLQLCEQFITEEGMAKCIKVGKSRYFDTCTLEFCQRFTTEPGSLGCLEASRDKHYLDAEMELCDRFTSEPGAIECLKSAGEPVRETLRDEVIKRVNDAIELIDEELYLPAKRKLEKLIEWLEENKGWNNQQDGEPA